jgi:hypothetical protein
MRTDASVFGRYVTLVITSVTYRSAVTRVVVPDAQDTKYGGIYAGVN